MNGGPDLRVFLAGEGANELGSRSGHPAYHSEERPGVIEALLRRTRGDGWVVGGARDWKTIRKFRVGYAINANHADTKNVAAVALEASERGCRVLAFTRDRDNDETRGAAIEAGIDLAKAHRDIEVIGGVATPNLEAWLLALQGRSGTEALSPGRAIAELEASGVDAKDTTAMVSVVEQAGAEIPKDASTLRRWLGGAATAFRNADESDGA